jgi:hypothetical protein
MHYPSHDQPRGVALVVAIFVLAVMSIILVAVMADVQSELKMSGVERNSERALKIAEAGVQIARATFMREDLFQNLTSTQSIASVDGFFQGGYFFASLGSGLPGNEKWPQWHYDSQISGHNEESEVSTPLRRVWATGARGRNGSWTASGVYQTTNIFAIIAGGTYFPIEQDTLTLLRAHDEYSGDQKVMNKPKTVVYWQDDKSLAENIPSAPGYNKGYATRLSPMASYSKIDIVAGEPAITQQAIYFTYGGDVAGGTASTTADMTTTVRLRAINSLCNPSPGTNPIKTLWEFDTGLHGVGTAPAFFDPSPGEPGDEIIYFAVVSAPGVDLRDIEDMRAFPGHVTQEPEQIYLYALVDTTGTITSCTQTGSYRLKWAHPFPDPDVADWTDYPTAHATGTNGQSPPYVREPADMTPFLPEDDLLFDYRDGPQNLHAVVLGLGNDGQRNQVRGNVNTVFDPQSISPPILNVRYRLNNGDLTTIRQDTLDDGTGMQGIPEDPIIDIYLTYAALSRMIGTWARYHVNGFDLSWGGVPGTKKKTVMQMRMIALRDQLDGSCTNGQNCTWNWYSARSRFPIFKWSARMPAWDPKQNDQRPWNGYGEYTWDTWFEQQTTPMNGIAETDQDGTVWADVGGTGKAEGGTRNLYPVLYPAYESLGYFDGWGWNNNINPPSTAQGAPESFDTTNKWDDSHMLLMAFRDTWDDYMEGNQTNPLFDEMVTQGNPYAIPTKSNPVELYWTHQDGNADDPTDNTYPESSEVVITYPQYPANADKIGFPRPYAWWEALWTAKVKGGSAPRDLDSQGWKNTNAPSSLNSLDIDIEGETSAFCQFCQDGDGLIVQVFNHDLPFATDREDLRVHAINARTGKHVWDYHMPAKLAGDVYNASPAIANKRVFVAYQSFGQRKALLQVLHASNGRSLQRATVDDDADAVVIPPSIANGAVYVGTYDHNGNTGNANMGDDIIRLFALSPVLRLVSAGIYPLSTSLMLESQIGKDQQMPRAERKLQVWISGAGNKWEEIREIYEP